MIPQTRKYHALIVHFGDEVSTKTLVAQLESGKKNPDTIIVIDHAKKPLTLERKPNLKIIRPEKNAGYGAGINVGLGVLAGQGVANQDIVIALNNDVQVSSHSLARIGEWWQAHPEAALAGIKMGHVNLITGRAEIDSTFQIPHSRLQLPYLDGACLMAPLSVFLALQGFPTQGFMYWEDVALSRRARQMKFPLRLIPNTGVIHTGRSSSAMPSGQLYYLVRNGAMFLSTFSPKPWRYLWKAINLLRLLYHCLSLKQKKSAVVRRALWDAWLQKTGPRS